MRGTPDRLHKMSVYNNKEFEHNSEIRIRPQTN